MSFTDELNPIDTLRTSPTVAHSIETCSSASYAICTGRWDGKWVIWEKKMISPGFYLILKRRRRWGRRRNCEVGWWLDLSHSSLGVVRRCDVFVPVDHCDFPFVFRLTIQVCAQCRTVFFIGWVSCCPTTMIGLIRTKCESIGTRHWEPPSLIRPPGAYAYAPWNNGSKPSFEKSCKLWANPRIPVCKL